MRLYLFLILFLLYSPGITAQTPLSGFRVSTIPTLKQLPVNAINCIFQDSEGYMWYGTVDGLCRDDSYSIHTFRSDFFTPGMIQINNVLDITEDSGHRIWFSTHKGIYILDKQTYSIKPLNVADLKTAHIDLLKAHGGSLWTCLGNRLYQISEDGKVTSRHDFPNIVRGFCFDSGGNMYVYLVNAGLYRKGNAGKTFELLDNSADIVYLYEDFSKKFLWVLCSNGISKYRKKDKILVNQFFDASEDNPTNLFRIEQDDVHHLLWVLAYNTLMVFEPQSGNSLTKVSTAGLLSPRYRILSSIYKDKDGNLWIGGFDTPSFVIRHERNAITHYDIHPLVERTGFYPSIVTLCRDDDGYIWYYQEGCGLFFLNPFKGTVVSYRDCPTRMLPLNIIPYLIRSKRQNCIWASTLTAIYMLSRKGDTMKLEKEIDMTAKTKRTGNLECVFEDHDGNLWISTMNGLYLWRNGWATVKPISENIGDISDFTQTSDGLIWFTIRNNGIGRLLENGKYHIYKHPMDFTTLDATSDGKLWVGTGEGRVLAFDTSSPDRYEDFTERCGMNGDMVDHIKVDVLNHVWIVTNQRIREFNPRNGAFRLLSTTDENVPLNRFLPRAVYKDPDTHQIFFGGIPGLIAISPSQSLEAIPKNVRVLVTDIKIMGKSVLFDSERERTANSIDINPDESNISIEFSSLNYTDRMRIRYAYRMKGVDKDWLYLPTGENVANYNHLAKGKYTFEVKATDENGLWSKGVTKFIINRLPAWYETWIAYCIYIGIGVALVLLLFSLYRRIEKERGERMMIENLLKAKQLQLQSEKPVQGISITPHKSFDEEFLNKAVKKVEQNLSNPDFGVVFLASELGMSRSTFMRRIKAVTGQTPLDFIKSVKLKHAYKMLEDKTASVQSVMEAIGYSDHKTFTQSFKDAFGITPSEKLHGGKE